MDFKAKVNVGILTLFGGSHEFMRACEPCVTSARDYANEHGYQHFIWDGKGIDRPISWARIPFLLTAMAEHPEITHFLWLDADAMITNPDLRLEPLADILDTKHRNILFSIDGANNLNDGVGLYRNCDWTKIWLESLWEMEEFINHPWWVNAALGKRYATEPELNQYILVANNPNLFNSYIKGRTPWRFGDFIVHFAGTSLEERRVLSNAFYAFIKATRASLPPINIQNRYYGFFD